MVQISIFLLFVTATIAPALAYPQPLPSRGGVVYSREDAFDLEQRGPSWDAVAHPMRTWKEHRKVKAITAAAKADAKASIKQEHADILEGAGASQRREYIDLEEREPSWDAVAHPVRTWKEHRKVKAITAAAKANAKASIKQEHADVLEGATERREYDDFDFEARDFEEEY